MREGSTGEKLAGGGVRSEVGGRFVGGGGEVVVNSSKTTLRSRRVIHGIETTMDKWRFGERKRLSFASCLSERMREK